MKKYVYVIIILVMVVLTIIIKRPITGSKVTDQALLSFEKIVESNKSKKTYHMDLNHFGFKLNDTEKIEWTKNTKTNKLDVALVINARDFKDVSASKLKAPFIYKEDQESGAKLFIYAVNVSDENKMSFGAIDGMKRVLSQSHGNVKYNIKNKAYVFNLKNGFELWWSNQNSDFNFAIVLNDKELKNKGLDLNRLPSGWKAYSNNQIIKYYKAGDKSE